MRVFKFLKAVREFVADGCRTASKEQYAERLEICEPCDRRVGLSCGECGCWLRPKAKMRTEKCPLSKWSENSDIEFVNPASQ